jgi:hypothetical protein
VGRGEYGYAVEHLGFKVQSRCRQGKFLGERERIVDSIVWPEREFNTLEARPI